MRRWGLTIEYSFNNIIRQNGEPGGSEYREIECDSYQEAESALKDFAKECENSIAKQKIPFFRTIYKYHLLQEGPYITGHKDNVF